jgi:acyl-CoA synthetase (AMP-forming)/AMP-acid ligase II
LIGDLVSALAASALRAPNAIAIRQAGQDTSYARLWNRAGRAAALFRQLGVEPGDRIAICLENSAAYVEAFYGALAARAIAVPLSAQAPLPELTRALAHSGARGIVIARTHADFAGIAARAANGLVVAAVGAGENTNPAVLNWEDGLLAAASIEPIAPEAAAAAAILYTSGTTGAPKGVTLSHGNLAANTRAILRYLRIGPDDAGLCVLPFHYAYGNSVLHTHLAAGARLVLENNLAYPHRIVECLGAEAITGMFGVPSTWTLLLARTRLHAADLRALRYVTVAGGALPGEGLASLRRALPNARVFVMYGQTEVTARITWLPPERLDDKAGTAGIPVQGMQVEIRDEAGRTLASGEHGEIWTRGSSVMLGYWNNAEATAAALKDGWLRTGDMGHLDAEGFLTIAGRRSDMIKVGSHRVHPSEIEEVILQLDGAAEVAVTGAPDAVLGQVVKAVVVTRAGAALSGRAVQAHCRARLAPHKVPRVVEFVERLPRTASGKVRRSALG